MNLEISGLNKTYSNGIKALKGVSLSIPTGMFGLLGPNGAGKSSLMRTLATLQEADSGSAFLGEIDVLKEKDSVRKILGYLPQEFGFYPRLDAVTLLDHFAALKGISRPVERREAVESLLHRVNLWDARKRKLGEYSGGMKQRFGIAQAMLGDPKLIIVDEPTAGLDPSERNRFHNLLSEIGENIVVILSTHIVDDVSDLCSRMAVINNGEILLTGEPLKAIEQLENRIWKKKIEKHRLPEYENQFKVISTRLVGGQTVIHIYSENKPESGFEIVRPELEDVYFTTLLNERKKAA